MISLQQVSKRFGHSQEPHQAVQSVSLDIGRGEIHGIIGSSGAGKSTLLRMMNLLERPDEGRVLVDGRELTLMKERELRLARRETGMIFQHFNLIANRTVQGNILLPLELAGVPKKERLARAVECLEFVGLPEKAGQYPAQLSGGQKQRVAIARALAGRPKVLLCDEPTSALDPQTTGDILEVLGQVNRELGVTIAIVTHEMDVVTRLCQRASVMKHGRIVATLAAPEGGRLSAEELAASYLNQANAQEGEVAAP
ncbi:methionine ABC transporter ATP-binding protein [Paenibacillus sp. CAA11]|uniref:methionine ABC transporter ATP-binding protein n=1 Tax=Paenibacillus sp. CAA11 TaxID=1532905 RepID=UPI001F4636BA|nr:methionine ABC transporter ATP-binding protein [Paenibacillus sp. CAA11]